MEEFLRVGVFAGTHGIKGEIRVFPTTDDANRFFSLKKVIIDTGRLRIPAEVEKVRLQQKFVIVKFRGLDSINDIEKYKGADLLVAREDAVPLEEGEFYQADVIGLSAVEEDGHVLGPVTEILETGANDVLIIDRDGRELLLPIIPACVLSVDPAAGIVKVRIPEGLEE